jgi:hypothetical protein
LVFFEIVNQQVTDRLAGELVAVDQFGRRALPGAVQLT